MHVIEANNVCSALVQGLEYLREHGARELSRNGDVLVAPGPVTTVTETPAQRVLFSARRDANPFFHLVESLWMLAGRDDTAMLDRYVRDFGSRFGETGGAMHGAYGKRWRLALGFDQLTYVVQKLRKDPTSRQCVIQMWDASAYHEITQEAAGVGTAATDHIYTGQDDLRGDWKDRPCNTHIYLRLRDRVAGQDGAATGTLRWLDMTVCCRSNDAIMGAHGANAVHFSVLQEYLAARIGVLMGRMYQVSNNYHSYTRDLERIDARAGDLLDDRYGPRLQPRPMFDKPDKIAFDLEKFFRWHDDPLSARDTYHNLWFEHVAEPAVRAHQDWKRKHYISAFSWCQRINAPDWRVACTEWIERRIER